MAMRDIEQIQKEASKLSPEEKVLLAERLLDEAREAKAGRLKPDTGRFRGILKLDDDAMEVQHRLRSEWD
ncbi:MAG: hypothetical protein ACR2HJ_02465 [Fimbriimonadales bacterium]